MLVIGVPKEMGSLVSTLPAYESQSFIFSMFNLPLSNARFSRKHKLITIIALFLSKEFKIWVFLAMLHPFDNQFLVILSKSCCFILVSSRLLMKRFGVTCWVSSVCLALKFWRHSTKQNYELSSFQTMIKRIREHE